MWKRDGRRFDTETVIIPTGKNLELVHCDWVANKSIQNKLWPFIKNNKMGFVDCEGKVIAKPQFDVPNGLIINDAYAQNELFLTHNNFLKLSKNNKQGVIDINTGEEIIEFEYDEITFQDGNAICYHYIFKAFGDIPQHNQYAVNSTCIKLETSEQ